jgi:hypothetical protein
MDSPEVAKTTPLMFLRSLTSPSLRSSQTAIYSHEIMECARETCAWRHSIPSHSGNSSPLLVCVVLLPQRRRVKSPVSSHLRTLLHVNFIQSSSYQWLPHSFKKKTGVGGYCKIVSPYLESPSMLDTYLWRCCNPRIVADRSHPMKFGMHFSPGRCRKTHSSASLPGLVSAILSPSRNVQSMSRRDHVQG